MSFGKTYGRWIVGVAVLAAFPAAASAQSAQEALDRLESRLLGAAPLAVGYLVTAEGAFTAELRGALRVDGNRDATLRGDGTFGGDPVELRLRATDGTIRGGNGTTEFESTESADLRSSLVLGLTRMGILHNLAMLTSSAPPDHAGGGTADWVQAVDAEWLGDDPDGRGPIERGIRFAIVVEDTRTAEAELWLGGDGLPIRRTQVVDFGGQVMRVTEYYDFTSVTP